MTCRFRLHFKSVEAPARPISIIALFLILATSIVSVVRAQTLTDPNPHAKVPLPRAKSLPTARTKSCSLFGAGFVNVPGTDACIKIGGYVTVEGTAKQGR